MASGSRVRLGVDERRARLLELGRTLFSVRPYDALSIDEIAAAAGISKGLLYHYFPSKREFYVETVRDACREMRERTAPDSARPPLERLNACVDAYLEYVDRHGALYAAVTRSGIGLDPEVYALVEDYRSTVARWVLDAVGIAEPRPAVRAALRAWVGAVEGASLDWIERRDLPRDALQTLIVGMLGAALESAMRVDPGAGVGLPGVI